MKLLTTLVLLLGLAVSAHAGPYYGITFSTDTGKASFTISGSIRIAVSSATPAAYTIEFDGENGVSFSVPITLASTMTITGNKFSVGGSTFVIDGGFVAIGKAVPTVALDVVGDGTFTGEISASSLLIQGFTVSGSANNATIQSYVCTAGIGRCAISSTDEGDLYISTGTLAGQFRNARTGKGP